MWIDDLHALHGQFLGSRKTSARTSGRDEIPALGCSSANEHRARPNCILVQLELISLPSHGVRLPQACRDRITNMSVLKSLFSSEKFVVVAFLFMLPLTIFAALGKIPIDAWRHDALWAIGFIVGGSATDTIASAISSGSSPVESSAPSAPSAAKPNA